LPALLQLVGANTQRSHDGEIRYKCQHTQLSAASKRLRVTDPRAYLRVYTTGNVGLLRFLRVMARAIVEEPLRKLGVTPRIFVSGTATSSDRELPLNLQPGDLVQVKSKEEIVATLTPDGRNRGLFFDREMLPYCGGTFRVKKRVTRFIDDRSGGKMISLKTDCLTLEGVVCSGELSVLRWFCPREIQSFWREAWLRRVDSDQIGSRENATRDPDVVLASELHAGRAQLAADELDSTI
jgi:hypothetical protein